MAANTDHLTTLIADGKLITRPLVHRNTPRIVMVDLDNLTQNITAKMIEIYSNDHRVRGHYDASAAGITSTITSDLTMLANYATAVCYNRLRTVLEKIYPTAPPQFMNPRAPVHNSLEFPAWISSVLGSIGPIIIQDGPIDQYVVYATVAARANTYGRAAATNYLNEPYARIMGVLRTLNIRTAPIDCQSLTGSAFPTIIARINTDQTWNLIGTIHRSHYENEDVARAIFCLSPLGVSPFDETGFTAAYVDDAATITALSAVAPPPHLPVGQTATSAPRSVDHHWDVNYFGIHPATTPAAPSGCYIIGRGVEPFYAHKRATDISNTDRVLILRSRLLSTGAAPAAADAAT